MIDSTQSIPCPECGTQITFDVKLLLSGTKFSCPNCKVSIGLASESSEIVEKTMEKFEDLKNNLPKYKE